jgi:hypothetical protein
MAAPAALAERIETGLTLVESDVRALPALASQWEQLEDGAQASLSLEWTHSMADYLTELDEHYRAGRMTRGQQERYQALLSELQAALPLIDRLKLYRPPVSLTP